MLSNYRFTDISQILLFSWLLVSFDFGWAQMTFKLLFFKAVITRFILTYFLTTFDKDLKFTFGDLGWPWNLVFEKLTPTLKIVI